MVARRPWVLLLPIALNLFLWLGPQISARPLFQQVAASLAIPPEVNASLDAQQGFATLKDALKEIGDRFNLFEFLGIAMPGLVAIDPTSTDVNLPRQTLFTISDALSLIAVAAPLTLIGFFLAALYLEGIARGVRPKTDALPVTQSYLRVTALVILLLVASALIVVPLFVAAAIITPFNQSLAAFVILLIFLLILWALVYLTFAIPAIFVGGVGAGQAILNSITIFRLNFWSAFGLILLIYLIENGFAVVWEQLGASVAGFVVDIVANAFLASGLVAAMMLFYQDRTLAQAQARQPARPSLKS